MEKKILENVMSALEKQVPELRWIDADEGQLDFAGERPAVAFPCCLVEMSYSDCGNVITSRDILQTVAVQINLRVAFNDCNSFAQNKPVNVRNAAFSRLDTLKGINKCMQGFRCEGMGKPFIRKSAIPQRRPDKIKVYDVLYEGMYMDKL